MPKDTVAVIDLEDLFAEEIAAAEAEDYDSLVVAKIKLFKDADPIRILESDNAFNQGRVLAGDPAAFMELVQAFIHPDDWPVVVDHLKKVRNLDGEKMVKFYTDLAEVASGRPIERPSPSRRSSTNGTTGKSSTAA